MLDSFFVTKHGNCFPRAVFGAEGAADTALDIHFDNLLDLGMMDAGDDFDAIDRTKNNAGLAARAS